jgi:tetratricopeptide (TPR) repeat protein
MRVGETMGVPNQVAAASVYLAELSTANGDNESAREHAQRALSLARKHGLAASEVAALQMVGRAQHDLEKSRAFFLEALALSHEYSLRPLTAQIKAELAWVVTELGDRSEGAGLATEANELRAEMVLASLHIPGLTD